MSNLTAQPPPQLSKDGRWRWDGHQWVLVKARSSRPSPLPGPGAPQHSPDGRWWWNGYQWVPAKPGSAGPPEPRGPGALANIAGGLGMGALVGLPVALYALAYYLSGTAYGWGTILAIVAVPLAGAVLGVLALVFPGHGHDRSLRRRVAWSGIAASVASAAGVLWMCLAAAGG